MHAVDRKAIDAYRSQGERPGCQTQAASCVYPAGVGVCFGSTLEQCSLLCPNLSPVKWTRVPCAFYITVLAVKVCFKS